MTTRTAIPRSAPLATACASYAGGLYYYEDRIGTVAITNLELGVNLMEKLTLAIGANNLFNRYPNQVNSGNYNVEAASFDNAAVEKYSPFSPFGIDGGFYYARIELQVLMQGSGPVQEGRQRLTPLLLTWSKPCLW